MSTDVVIIDEANLPSYLLNEAPETDDLGGGLGGGFGVLSIKGKVWSVSRGGVKTKIMRPDDEDSVASHIEVVIMNANDHLSKVYYPSGYKDGSDDKPVCYSHNGITPELDAASPQSPSCASCEHNAWGSRITENGKKAKACVDSRRVAVAPVGDLDDVMLLRVPAASLRDLAEYSRAMKQRGVPYWSCVTKIGFDPDAAHPQLTFKMQRWLDKPTFEKVRVLRDADIVKQIIGKEGAPAPSVMEKASPGLAAVAAVEVAVESSPKKPKTEKPRPDKIVKETPVVDDVVEEASDDLDKLLASFGEDE